VEENSCTTGVSRTLDIAKEAAGQPVLSQGCDSLER
jgi:hypothetical protein